MSIQSVEVHRNAGNASNSGHVAPCSRRDAASPINHPMQPMVAQRTAHPGALGGLRWRQQEKDDPHHRPIVSRGRASPGGSSMLSRTVARCSALSFRLSLALVVLFRELVTNVTTLSTRHRSGAVALLHRHHYHRQHGRRRRPPPKEAPPLAPPAAQDSATAEHRAACEPADGAWSAGSSMHLSTTDVTTKLVLLIMVLIAVIGHSEAGTCWLRRIESTGKCSQLFTRNVTRESCCAAGSGAKGFSEKDIPDVGLFFINAFNDGMACSSCLDTCDRAKCAPNKRCVMRRNRPKCICAPTCSGGRSPKRNNRVHRMHQMHQNTRFHQQNIKVINLSESQRNRRQYFADDGRHPRPRQLRYTGPEVTGASDRRSVKTSSLSEPRSPGSQRVSAKQSAKDSDKADKDKKHNLLESVTLVSSSSDNSDNGKSSSSKSTSKGTHQSRSRVRSSHLAPVNCTASGGIPTAGCSMSASLSPSASPTPGGWTGGERMVLLQDAPASPNGLALNHPTGKSTGDPEGHPTTTTTAASLRSTRRHHRKVMPTADGNLTMVAATHRKLAANGRDQPQHKPTVVPFAAFGKPKLLRVPKQVGWRQNGTVRVPRREPQYLDDVFFTDNFHHRTDPQSSRMGMDDFLGNEIMHHSSFYNPVCGTDGKTYKTECQLKKRACRQELTSLMVAYKGHCQTSCKFVKCTDGKRCVEDQNATPHCVTCGGAECRSDRSPKSVVCGTDGITYPSICELKRQACVTGRAIPVAYRGRCIEAATCETIKCKDRQHCLTDLKTHKPRCVSCSYKCPRMKRQQGNGKSFRNAKNNPFNEQSVKLCGTNNRTYHSWCHMLKDSCNTGFYIDVQYSGSCAFVR